MIIIQRVNLKKNRMIINKLKRYLVLFYRNDKKDKKRHF